MKHGLRLAAVAVLLSTLGCAEEITAPRASVTLTASQAEVLVSRAQLIASARPELAWLADSIDVVLTAGAEARMITMSRDGITRSFYAVGLTRQFAGVNPFSTFHLIAFDEADNPSSFLLANGYTPGSDAVPPNSAFGAFGGDKVFAHFVSVSGADVKDLVAISGEAAFVLGDVGASCAGNPSVTCNRASLVADFKIDTARSELSPTVIHSVAQTHVVVPGILLRYN